MRLIVTNAKTFVDGNKAHQALVFKALSFKTPNHHAINAKTGRKWNGITSMHNRRNKTFPSGLLPRVEAFLTHNRFNYVKVDKRAMPKKPLWPVSLHDITLRGYQQTSLLRFLTYHRGILQLGTGAGKTEVAVAVAKSCNVPMIFLTHRVNLLHQAAERFAKRWPEAKDLIGIVGGGQHDFRYLTFATVQTMHSTIKKYGKQILDELRQYGLIIIDEAHRVGAKQFHETADCFPNAFWRLGLTATPFMFEDPRDNLQLEGTLGPVVHKVSSSDLIEAGVLARPYFKFFPINHPVDMGGLTNWRDVYEEGIVYNSFRNEVIVKNAVKLIEMGHKPLIIVQETNHGTILKAGIEVAGKRVSFMTGKDDAALRVRSLKALSEGKVDAVIATNIFDEGIDVKNVSAIILAAGTKSAPSLFQRTGRAIRKKDDGGHAVIIDFIDKQHKTLEKQSLKRVSLVKSEPAFKIV